MRVQVSARSGTMTPNSSEPKRVLVAGSCLEEVPDLLIDRDALGPAGRRVGPALDVAGEEFDAGEQAADAAHVAVAVAANAIADAVQRQDLVLERLQRLRGFPAR